MLVASNGSPFDCHHLPIRLPASFIDNSIAALAYCLLNIIVSKAASDYWDCAILSASLLLVRLMF